MINWYLLILQFGYIGGWISLTMFLFSEMDWSQFKNRKRAALGYAIGFFFVLPFTPFICLFIGIKDHAAKKKRSKTKEREDDE